MGSEYDSNAYADGDIAIVGMAVHLPGADNIQQFWSNLADGVESIQKLSEKELLRAGEPLHRIKNPNYVPAAAKLDNFEMFDGDFFGLSPKESAIMDPQHRQFLECSWEAMENAGHPPESIDGPVGVYAGCGMGSYFYFNICSNPDLVEDTGMFLLRHTGNDKDFLSTRLSHILNLKGPSINIQTACSTSLVATHYACQSLQNGECDMALAGGVTVELPHGRGYIFQEGEILSPDGHCHAFDHRAQGTVFGSGVGVVVLRRIEDALRDGDHIWAVIKGSAINNDGSDKAGYLAPSVDGQAAAIAEAHAMADVTADTIDYIECHGTGTYLGDPIEVAALTHAFQETTNETGFCKIGSVKTNIGHTDTAAGVASLVKASLSLKNKTIPPTLGFEKPNPAIDFDSSPFSVAAQKTDWISHKGPRRAGVNSLGVGGTNAHVVLEEASTRPQSEPSDWPFQLLTVSAKSANALDDATENLAAALEANPNVELADIAWTLKEGRRGFEKRRVVVAESHEDGAALLRENDARRVFTHTQISNAPKPVFMFPGGGAQYANMARDLYETEPVFQDWMDQGLEVLQAKIDYDIRAIWLPDAGEVDAANETLRKPSIQLPLIMIAEYALAQLWMSWGVTPDALIGHSMGENTAACVAGVLSFEDCIALVHLRGKLFDTVPAGGMLSVPISAEELTSYLDAELDLAAENGPSLSVASGPRSALERLKNKLAADKVDCQDIPIDIAAHSQMLEPILDDFRAFLQSIHLSAPSIPFISNRTGDWIKNSEATDPDYWVAHLRNTVFFAAGIQTLAENAERIYLEVGPGKVLASLAQSHPDVSSNQVIGTLRHEKDEIADDKYFLAMLGRLWAVGLDFDWSQYWGDQKRYRVPLPTYPFQRSAYFIEPGETGDREFAEPPTRMERLEDWGYRPVWVPKSADCPVDIECDLKDADHEVWLIFVDDTGVGEETARRLRENSQKVITVKQGDSFARDGDQSYLLSTEQGREGFDRLFSSLITRGLAPTRIVHLWLTTNDENFRPGSSFYHRNIEQGYYNLLFMLQAIEDIALPKPLHICVVSSDSMKVRDEALLYPEKSMVSGPIRVAPREFSELTCAHLDLSIKSRDDAFNPQIQTRLSNHVLEEILSEPRNSVAAVRGGKRFVLDWRNTQLRRNDRLSSLPKGGTCLITGGFGGIGLSLARHFAKSHRANLVLVSRGVLPERDQWDYYLESNAPNDRTAQRILAVRDLEALGVDVLPLSANISNLEEMQAAAQQAEDRFGRINLVIHGAGVLDDSPILGRRPQDTEKVFAPKLHGTQVLASVFPDGDIDELVLFSSTSTFTAPAGQVDYVAANEYLNAFAKSRAGGTTRVTALNWGIWSDVGMAAETAAPKDFDPQEVPMSKAKSPLFGDAHFDKDGNRIFYRNFSADQDWVFDEHRTNDNKALMPGTGYIELAAEAMHEQHEPFGFDIQNLYFMSPFHIPDGTTRRMRTRIKRSRLGYEFKVQSNQPDDSLDAWQTHCESEIVLSEATRPDPIDFHRIGNRLGWTPSVSDDLRISSPQDHLLKFGDRWNTLVNQSIGDSEGLAELQLTEKGQSDEGFILHPALLDIATGWAIQLVPGYVGSHLWVPMSYQSVRVFAPLTDKVFSWARLSPRQTDFGTMASVDVTICDPQGNVLVDVVGFQMQRQDRPDFLDTAALLSAPLESDTPATASVSAATSSRMRHLLSQGIKSDEGVALFDSALEQGLSQIVISSMDVKKLIANTIVESQEALRSTTHNFQRPKLETEFAKPESEVEKTLAEFWQDLLGVQDIGVDDSFFELGGHSLIAVRMFSQIRKSFGVNFPISVLFEAPTIRQIAGLVEKQTGRKTTDADGPSSDALEERRFKHLVPMHEGEGGPRYPFFLVAGMFGNVLNLRHLAQLLGSDRPFFGLQAKGLLGSDRPHQTIHEAAKDYIAEMRAVQPTGPYFIGGYSGGGIHALEIAQQLKAAGEECALLVLLDTPLPKRRPLSTMDRIGIQLQNVMKDGFRYPLNWVQSRIKWRRKQKTKAIALQVAEPEHQFHNAQIEAAFLGAIEQYEPNQWAGSTVLFRPPLVPKWQLSNGHKISHERSYLFEDNDWGDLLPNILVSEVPGDHDSMVLEPNVRVMATRMRHEIEKAEREFLLRGPETIKRAAE